MGLILDTSILIASERRGESVEDILRKVRSTQGEIDIALSTVSVVELMHGMYRARTDAQRERRRLFAEGVFQDLIIHPVSLEIAQLAARSKASRPQKASPSPSKTSSSVPPPCTSATAWPPST
jgi:tRNA(fMet)-specific endonuclease VapC